MTAKELITLLRAYPEDTPVVVGNEPIRDISMMPSYYDGTQQVIYKHPIFTYTAELVSSGSKIKLIHESIYDHVAEYLPLYTPLLYHGFDLGLSTKEYLPQGNRQPTQLESHRAKTEMVLKHLQSALNEHIGLLSLGTWELFWKDILAAHRLDEPSEHEKLVLMGIEARYKALWQDTDEHFFYGDFAALSYDILKEFKGLTIPTVTPQP